MRIAGLRGKTRPLGFCVYGTKTQQKKRGNTVMNNTDAHGENIYNADVFKVLVDSEISRSRRYPTPLAVIEIEVKPVSSHEGILRSPNAIFLTALSKNLRSVDIPAQTGETFKVLLPTTDASGARVVCDRLLSVFKNKFDTPDGHSIAFSLHIGAAVHGGGPSLSKDELFTKTAEALSQAKLKGAHTYVLNI
jgi:hypothetical protein